MNARADTARSLDIPLAFCLVAPRDAAEPRDDWENHGDEDSDEDSNLL